MKNLDLIKQMTIEEKASLLSGKNFWETMGIDRLNIPSIFLSDGPHGIRKQAGAADHLGLNASVPATCFPTAATVANSWDLELAERIGIALGEEAISEDVNVVLGPGINMKRNPLCGRNFEYFAEDPYLAGKIAARFIKGIQSNGISACVKHFAANNQEERRMVIDTIIDERALREIYLTAFEIVVKEAGTKTIMTSYNRLNGKHTNENEHLLLDILRGEWGYQGVVVTDWGGENDRVAGLKCSNELEMPTTHGDTDAEIVAAVKNGSLDEKLVDEALDRFLTLVFDTQSAIDNRQEKYDVNAHHQLAREVAEQSIVLLKNEDKILPLSQGQKVAVIGDFASFPRYQGAGSSIVNPTKLDNTLDVFGDSGLSLTKYAQGYDRYGKSKPALLNEAVEAAKHAEIVLFYLGLDEDSEAEGLDRTTLQIPQNQIEVFNALKAVNKNIVAVLSCGSVVDMSWAEGAKAIVHGYLSGQAGARAALNVITGKINPSGRLAETYPMVYEDVASSSHFPGKEVSVEYRESLYIGYRYFTTAGVPVKYPFGYGLSYTDFDYSNLKVTESGATFTIKNIGTVDGAEVAQLYVSKSSDVIFRPKRELKGFVKVFLKAGEAQEVTIPFDDKTFRYFNIKTNQWEVEAGAYDIQIGKNVMDIQLNESIEKQGTTNVAPYEENKAILEPYFTGKVANVSQTAYETLLGRPVPDAKWDKKKPLGYNDTLMQMSYAKGWVGRFAYHLIHIAYKFFKLTNNKKMMNTFEMLVFHMPFRGMARMSAGALTMEMVDGLLLIVNGHFFKGISLLIKGKKHQKQVGRKDA